MGAVEKDVLNKLLILYIMSITQVMSRGGIVCPGRMGTKSEVSHVANNVTRKIKKHVSSKLQVTSYKLQVKGSTASQVVRLIGLLLVFASQKNSTMSEIRIY